MASALDLPLRHVIVQNKEEVRRERIERRLRFPKNTLELTLKQHGSDLNRSFSLGYFSINTVSVVSLPHFLKIFLIFPFL